MAATDSTPFPVRAQAFRLYFKVISILTCNPITGGLTGLSTAGNRQISIDGAAFANLTNNPVEIGTTGYAYVDLTAAEMTGDHILIRIAATNSNAKEVSVSMNTTNLSEIAGRADAHTVKRPEQFIKQIHQADYNLSIVDRDESKLRIYNDAAVDADDTVLFEGDATSNPNQLTRGKLDTPA